MEDYDMRPGGELFPETSNAQYNSYLDVMQDQVVEDPLNTGFKPTPDEADLGKISDKELNFKALRDEVSKMKEEREYWKGQAEAYSKAPAAPQESKQDAYSALDWDDSNDVRKAFETVRQENVKLREEFKDALAAVQTKANRQDWNQMVTQHVPTLTNQNPIFAEMIQNVSNPYEAAYLLAELNARASQSVAQQPPPAYNNGNAQRVLQNASKPQSLASVGGKGQLSQSDYYASMSDEDFMKLAGRNLANV
jgi:hypothetical protein